MTGRQKESNWYTQKPATPKWALRFIMHHESVCWATGPCLISSLQSANNLTWRPGLNNIAGDRCSPRIPIGPVDGKGRAISRDEGLTGRARGSWSHRSNGVTWTCWNCLVEIVRRHGESMQTDLLQVLWWCWPPPPDRRWRFWRECGSCTWRHPPGLWFSATGGRSPSRPLSRSYWRLGGRGSEDSRHRPLRTLDRHTTFSSGNRSSTHTHTWA